MIKLLFIYLSLGIFSFSQTDLKTKIENTYKSTKSIQADFTQTKVSSILKNPVIKKGRFYYQGDNIKWMITSPKKNTTIITAKSARQKVENNPPEDLKKFTFIKKFMQGLMKGDFLNEKKFQTTVVEKNSIYYLTAVPIDSRIKKYISKFELEFRKSDIILNKLTIFENSGDYTSYEFKNQKRNAVIPASTFEKFH